MSIFSAMPCQYRNINWNNYTPSLNYDNRLILRFATTTSFAASVLLWYQWFCNYTYNYVLRSFIRTHGRTGYSTILISTYISSSTPGTDISIYDLLKFFNTDACFYIEKQDTYKIYLQKNCYHKVAHNIIYNIKKVRNLIKLISIIYKCCLPLRSVKKDSQQ